MPRNYFPKIPVQRDAILARFQNGLYSKFHRNGTTEINVFNWLLQDGAMRKMIYSEFDCYRWHQDHGSFPEASALNRIMLHSLVQQLVSQDPVQYSLFVALRRDNHPELISYPCCTQYSYVGSSNIAPPTRALQRMLDTGRGIDMIHGLVALDNEDDDNCSHVAIGLHHRMNEWKSLIALRETAFEADNPKSFSHEYLQEDAVALGLRHYVPSPCRRGDLRINAPHLPHLQPSTPTQNRRVINSWFVAINADEETLEDSSLGSLDSVIEAHRYLKHPRQSPVLNFRRGQKYPYPFPAAVEVRGLGPLSDALIGQRSWLSPAVRTEAAFYLDGKKSQDEINERIEAWRALGKKRYTRAFAIFEQEERRIYGAKSFFQHMDSRRRPDFSMRPVIDHSTFDNELRGEGRRSPGGLEGQDE